MGESGTMMRRPVRLAGAVAACVAGPVLLAGCVPQPYAAAGYQPVYAAQPQVVVQPVLQAPPQGVQPALGGAPGLGQLPPSIARAFPVQGVANTPHPGRAPTLPELESVGQVVRVNNAAGRCQVDMVLIQGAFFNNIPTLQRLGLLNTGITPQVAQTQVASVAMAFTLQAAPIVAHLFLSQPAAPFACHFTQSLGITGAGPMQQIPLFEFDMDRNTDAQAPWPRLLTAGFSYNDANMFVSAVPSFRLTPGALQRIRQEQSF